VSVKAWGFVDGAVGGGQRALGLGLNGSKRLAASILARACARQADRAPRVDRAPRGLVAGLPHQ